MRQTLLLPVGLLVLLQLPAFAQTAVAPKPPKYCHPCLVYAGDFRDTRGGDGLANEEDVMDPKAAVFVPFDVPKNQEWKVIGLFTNDISGVDLIDPEKAAWWSSSHIKQGKCGRPLVSGNSHATFRPTGRGTDGFYEYTTLVKIKAVDLKPGRYWLTTIPECTKGSSCTKARYFASSFDGKPLDPFGPPEPCICRTSIRSFSGQSASPHTLITRNAAGSRLACWVPSKLGTRCLMQMGIDFEIDEVFER